VYPGLLPSYDITDPVEVFANHCYSMLAGLIGFRSPGILEQMRGGRPGFEPLLDMVDELRNAGVLSDGRLVPRQVSGEWVSTIRCGG
jgi:hypothetical protein